MPTSVSPGRLVGAKLSTLERAQLYVMAWTRYLLPYVPGVALLVILAMTARLIGRNGLDSYTLVYAILLGILIRNTIGLSAWLEPGTRIYEVLWKVGIVLLGSQMGLHSFSEVGFKGVALAAVEVVASIALTLWLTRIFKIRGGLRSLLAVGMAICGVSAIIALSSAMRSDEEDTSYAVSVILCFGLLGLAVLPFVGHLMLLNDLRFGLWAGLAVNNTAEAVATGFTYSESAGHYATIAKLCRTLFLDAALLYFVHGMVREKMAETATSTLRGLIKHFPKFALGLIVFSALATFHYWSPAAVANLNHLYRWAFLLGFAGVGLRTSLSRLRTRGLRPLVLALGVQTITAIIMLICVRIFF
jgi:uncharacterized integral membrane protein (TIGR00698 family)